MANLKYIHNLYQQMLTKKNSSDLEEAVAIAREILSLSPRNRPIMEDVADIFITANFLADAHASITFIENHFHSTPYLYVLKTQLAYGEGDYQTVLDCAPIGIDAPTLGPFYKAVLYNILAKVYLALGDTEKSASISLKSAHLPGNPSKYWEYGNYLFALQHRNIPKQQLFSAISDYSTLFQDIEPYEHSIKHHHDQLRIGYISADFNNSVVSHFTYALFTAYNKERFVIYAYNMGITDDTTQKLKASVNIWREVGNLAPAEASALIYADDLDILFDLAGHTNHNGLPIMAYKPAPIQISGIGWMNSTGLPTIDYFLTDVNVDPVGLNDDFFTEKLLRLPNSHFCYTPFQDIPPAIKPAPFSKTGYITFGCFNRFEKVTDEMLVIWAHIMKLVPNSHLILRSQLFTIPLVRKTAINRLITTGFDISRIRLEGFVVDYLGAYGEIDIALDTFPYPGGGTTCDALYAGVPVVTLIGKSHNSRFGYSILKNLELEELCANTPDDYIKICVELANSPDLLNQLHILLQNRMKKSSLMNKELYMHDLENYYIQLVAGTSDKLPCPLDKHNRLRIGRNHNLHNEDGTI